MSDEPNDEKPNVVQLPAPDEPEYDFSEDQIALDFADRFKQSMRHEGSRKCWFAYSGKQWKEDLNKTYEAKARVLCRDISNRMLENALEALKRTTKHNATRQEIRMARGKVKNDFRSMKKVIRSIKTVRAVVAFATSDAKLTIDTDQWDANKMILNAPNGTINLESGVLHPHRFQDYITKCCGVSMDRDVYPEVWLRTLDQIFQGSQEMVDYIQRVLGYCITGRTHDHAIFYLWGGGQNGKTTILETFGHILGDYWIESPPQTFTSGESRHETEIARMRGARTVSSDELPTGQSWDTSKLKRLTGGGTISARFMYGNYFEFTPQFKLLIAGNDRPKIQQVDEGIRRRINIIPFQWRVPDELKDKYLPDKLMAEAPGILAWIVDGCLAWQSRGLDPPELVKDITKKYLESQNHVAIWFDECCIRNPEVNTPSIELFSSFSEWSKLRERKPGSYNTFSDKLDEITNSRGRNKKGSIFRGIDIIDKPPPMQPLKQA